MLNRRLNCLTKRNRPEDEEFSKKKCGRRGRIGKREKKKGKKKSSDSSKKGGKYKRTV